MSHCIESAYIIATLIGCFIAARLINFILDWQHRKKLENVGKARFVRVSESWIECNGSSEIKSEHVDENGAKSEHENENEIISEDHRLKKDLGNQAVPEISTKSNDPEIRGRCLKGKKIWRIEGTKVVLRFSSKDLKNEIFQPLDHSLNLISKVEENVEVSRRSMKRAPLFGPNDIKKEKNESNRPFESKKGARLFGPIKQKETQPSGDFGDKKNIQLHRSGDKKLKKIELIDNSEDKDGAQGAQLFGLTKQKKAQPSGHFRNKNSIQLIRLDHKNQKFEIFDEFEGERMRVMSSINDSGKEKAGFTADSKECNENAPPPSPIDSKEEKTKEIKEGIQLFDPSGTKEKKTESTSDSESNKNISPPSAIDRKEEKTEETKKGTPLFGPSSAEEKKTESTSEFECNKIISPPCLVDSKNEKTEFSPADFEDVNDMEVDCSKSFHKKGNTPLTKVMRLCNEQITVNLVDNLPGEDDFINKPHISSYNVEERHKWPRREVENK